MSTLFIKKVVVYFVGSLSTKILSILLLPLYAYFVALEDLGNYDYLIAVSYIVAPILFVSLWEAVLKWGIKERLSDEFDAVISTIIIPCLIMSIITGIFCLTCSLFFQSRFNFLTIWALTIMQGFACIWQFAARSRNISKDYVKSGVLGSFALILVNVFFVYADVLDCDALAVSYIVSQFVIVFYLELKMKLLRLIRFAAFNIFSLKKFLYFTAPLVINNLALWVYTSGSKVIVQNNLGAEVNGLFSFAIKFSILINLFSSVISMAVIEDAYSYSNLVEYREKMRRLISVISRGYFAMIMLSVPLIHILYFFLFKTTPYFESVDYVLPFLLSALFSSLSNNFGSAFQVTNKTKYISVTTILGAFSAIVVSLCLVGRFGVYGVLLGNVIGPAIMMLLRSFYAKKTTGLSIDWTVNIVLLLFSLLMGLLLFYNRSLLFSLVCLTFSLITIAALYKNIFCQMILRRKK